MATEHSHPVIGAPMVRDRVLIRTEPIARQHTPTYLSPKVATHLAMSRQPSRPPTSVIAACVGFAVGTLFWWAAMWNIEQPGPTCIPRTAVGYDGTRDAWVDVAGAEVLHAVEEDQYPWCDR